MICGAVLTVIDEHGEERSVILSADQLQAIVDVLGIVPGKKPDELKMWSDNKLRIMHYNGLKEIAHLISKPKCKTIIKASELDTDSKIAEIKVVMGDYLKILKDEETTTL